MVLRIALVFALLSSLLAQDIELGPETTIDKDPSGRFLVITDGRSKSELMLRVDRIVAVKGANPNDNNSFTEISLGLGDKDENSTIVRVQQRTIPYERIKQMLLK